MSYLGNLRQLYFINVTEWLPSRYANVDARKAARLGCSAMYGIYDI